MSGKLNESNNFGTLPPAAGAGTVLYPDAHRDDRARDLSGSPTLQSVSPIEFSETVRQRAKAMLLLSGGYPNRYTRVLYAIVQSGLMLQLIEDGSTRIGGCMSAEIETQEVLKEACISDDATATRFLDCADGILKDWDRELRAINAEHEKQLQVFREKIL